MIYEKMVDAMLAVIIFAVGVVILTVLMMFR